jgi:hypothetical protein
MELQVKIQETKKIRKRQEKRIAELTTVRDEMSRNTSQILKSFRRRRKRRLD